jgi:septum formation protein
MPSRETINAAPVHLASSSPRRHEILTMLGIPFSAAGVDVDESRLQGETAEDMVQRLAVAKATAADADEAQMVVGADTMVVIDGEPFGKPEHRQDALRMLAALSDRAHQVLTGVAVRSRRGTQVILSRTDVRFRQILPDEALAYWQSGEPCDKAGAYAIQGRGGIFVAAIEGSYSGVVGLPVFETTQLLSSAGFNVLQQNTAQPCTSS